MLFEIRLVMNDSLIDFIMVLVEVRWVANYQFIEEGTNAINISSSIMALAHKNLWAHVLWGATERVGPLSFWDNFRQSKICNFNMAVNINKNILWLDISVDDVLIMEVFQT